MKWLTDTDKQRDSQTAEEHDIHDEKNCNKIEVLNLLIKS